ncbi:MAG TPA: CoA transferase [Candidatus Binataceae bacterium]
MSTSLNGKVRVVDISMGWAGPLAGELLAEMGAEVVKIEDTEHFDWWRGSLSMAEPALRPIERAATFNAANRGKFGVTLDLAHRRGIEIVKRLVEIADVVIENYSPGVMDRFGLGYPILSKINPRLIMVSMPSFGSDGPECNVRGYGNTVEAMAGITGLAGYHDGEQRYTLSNALGDPVGGLHGALAVLAALHERDRTGQGQWVEIAQVESAIPFVTDAILEYQFAGEVPRPRGNRHPRFAPHGIFRCVGQGSDQESWIAVAAESDQQWRVLAKALNLAHFAEDPRFATAADRKKNEDVLDSELARVFVAMEPDDAVRIAREAGALAAHVNSAPAVLGDSQLQSRGFWVPIDRAVVGTHLYPGAVAKLPETPLQPDRPAPLLGQHNAEIFSRLLGMSADEIRELEESGVIGSIPRDYRNAS